LWDAVVVVISSSTRKLKFEVLFSSRFRFRASAEFGEAHAEREGRNPNSLSECPMLEQVKVREKKTPVIDYRFELKAVGIVL
jgi:hypothetical protein